MRPAREHEGRDAAGADRIAIGQGAHGAVIERLRAASPLVLLQPRNHGGAAWIFAGTLGGGLVDGDHVALDVEVGAGAALLLATQASTKIYRGTASQRVDARIADGALLASLPDPVTCFAGARYQQDAVIALDAGASLLWLDGLTAGRVAHGERWAFARYAARLCIDVAGARVIDDAMELDAAHGDASIAARMDRFAAIATAIAIGPRVATIAAAWLAPRAAPRPGDDVRIAISPIAGGAIARIAATTVEGAARAARGLLVDLPILLGDDPFRNRH